MNESKALVYYTHLIRTVGFKFDTCDRAGGVTSYNGLIIRQCSTRKEQVFEGVLFCMDGI